jgi:hypothetical protein
MHIYGIYAVIEQGIGVPDTSLIYVYLVAAGKIISVLKLEIIAHGIGILSSPELTTLHFNPFFEHIYI